MPTKISNWNNYPAREVNLNFWRGEKSLQNFNHWIARGMGRCYGDASLSDNVISTVNHNLFIDFDQDTGILRCQSGVTLDEILQVFVPKGWFLPVTPGTKFITVGGALASDVHGKNHHVEGCFGDHVLEFTLLGPDGNFKTCSPTENRNIFNATRGGMGLTGMIDQVTFPLKKISTAYIKQKQVKAKNLQEIFELFQDHKHYTYSMAWIDCLKGGKQFGRSIMMAGEHAQIDELSEKQKKSILNAHSSKQINMPINLPSFVLNKLSIKAFNQLYYAKNIKKEIESVVHYDGFFYPLDAILHWNRMYGKKGFIQYQFVLPLETSEQGLTRILKEISNKGWGSFLAVLKLFGKQDSLISFPMEGYTLALDFPIKKGLFPFLDELDKIVLEFGGRIYLSKDARMKPEMLEKGYPNFQEFSNIIHELNPDSIVQSDLSQRLNIN